MAKEKELTVNQRFRTFLKWSKKKPIYFIKNSRISGQMVYDYVNLKSEIGIKFLVDLKKLYPELNLNWLISGEGEMIIKTGQESEETGQDINQRMTHLEKEQEAIKRELKRSKEYDKSIANLLQKMKDQGIEVDADILEDLKRVKEMEKDLNK